MSQRSEDSNRPRRKPWLFSWKFRSGDPHRHCSSANRTAAEDKAIARRALAEEDPRHASIHVAGALFDNPNDREALDLADEIMQVSNDPLEYVPVQEKNYAGTMALRAYFLGKMGRLAEAIQLLRQVMRIDAQKPFEFWALRWLDAPEALEQVKPVDVAGVLSLAIVRFPGHSVDANSQAMSMLRPWVEIARKFMAQHPQDAILMAVGSLVIRRTGDFESALALANDSYRLEPSFMAATARATVHEARQELDAAMAAYQDALAIDPNSAEVLADMAIIELRRQNFAGAMEHTRLGLRFEPKHRTLEPLEWFLEFKLNQDQKALDKLAVYVRAHPGHRAEEWLAWLSPFVGVLPPSREATLNVLEQVLPKLCQSKDTVGRELKLTLSAIEAPSAILATRRALEPFGMSLPVTVQNVAQPDPRVPCRQVAHTLWEYEGTEPRPAMPAPPEVMTKRVSTLAQSPYGLWEWGKKAGEIARSLTVGDLPALLATMVHPAKCPDPKREAEWILRHQVAAALITLQVREGPLEGSPAEAAMLSLLFGPMDWTNIAGIIALAYEAATAQNHAVSTRIAHQFIDRLKATPRPGDCCFSFSAFWALANLPKIDPKAHEEFVAMYNEYVKNS